MRTRLYTLFTTLPNYLTTMSRWGWHQQTNNSAIRDFKDEGGKSQSQHMAGPSAHNVPRRSLIEGTLNVIFCVETTKDLEGDRKDSTQYGVDLLGCVNTGNLTIWTILEIYLVIYKSNGAPPDLPKLNAIYQTSDMGPLPPSFTAAAAIIIAYFPTLSNPQPESVRLPRLASPFPLDYENKQSFTQASPNNNEHVTTRLVSKGSLEQATPIPSNEIMEWLAKNPGLEAELSTITTYFSVSGKNYGDMVRFFSCPDAETCRSIWHSSATPNNAVDSLLQSEADGILRVNRCIETTKWQLVQNLVDYPLDGVCSYSLFPPGAISTNDTPNKVEWIIHQKQGLGYSGVWQYDREKAALSLLRQDNIPHGLFVLLASTVLRCLESSPSVMLSEIQNDGIYILVLAYTGSEPYNDAIQFDRMPMLDKYMGPFFNGNQGRYLVDLYVQCVFEGDTGK
ncbi:hypothetical protein TEQG_03403 [Trichophyton equinum CBS 127.97]|uniref:Uncharacterized protein n=1 Tax=Trichophyton equinum (strain ATCC MYA-4606 / CBS 127.97) TaxID=559882 RepID=F2PRL4_TRIEC|nr:hypothetical protein TEQG_03403 [Trichophyton equinum CBS 127.97]